MTIYLLPWLSKRPDFEQDVKEHGNMNTNMSQVETSHKTIAVSISYLILQLVNLITSSEKAKALRFLTTKPQLHVKLVNSATSPSEFESTIFQFWLKVQKLSGPNPKSFPTTCAKSFWKRESSCVFCSLSLILNDMTQNWWQSSQSNCRSARHLATPWHTSPRTCESSCPLSTKLLRFWLIALGGAFTLSLYHTSDIVSVGQFILFIE